jgi:hypothetical protein
MNERSRRANPRWIDRRQFVTAGVAASLAGTLSAGARTRTETGPEAHSDPQVSLLTGNGEWTYRVIAGWGTLPSGTSYGGTHGAVAQDRAGNVYVSTQSATGVLVFAPEGTLLKTIATQYPEVHSMIYSEEDGQEYLYTTVQKGTPLENWLFVKMKTDGTVVQKITAPPEAGFKTPNEWRLTAAVRAPDGGILIANGYGDSRLFRFDRQGQYKASYSGKGDSDGLLNCSHGLSVDTRYDQPLLMVCDRENRRLCHFDFDGKFVRTITQHLRRPCQASFYGEYVVVSELEGRVTILDRDNVPVAFLGDNPHREQWAKYEIEPPAIASACFSAAHGCFVDRDGNVYVSDWNRIGRVTKLARIRV